MDHARIAQRCQQIGRVYVPSPEPSEETLVAALRHAIEAGGALTLTGFDCPAELVPVIQRKWLQRGWARGTWITAAGREAARNGGGPWTL
ncbi:hypothetical protein [Azospirillum doebereinerae]|uniref:Uncharacterized protein n=1 Tax=Azospirillum doebereinerae TaxID=92933 RepID=A0A3S0WRZ7_9PROT|nr:hypothetical protein [Azospirillum doebereinerae]RUQ66012.1 hypothetical protein EJ913_24555 [Azospirillum doebereinerae]